MTNQIIKIFLASSEELKEDREQFEIFINRKNKEYIKQGIFLELVIWEDFLDAMSATSLQDEYNKAIRECDVVISLFKTKVGQYTEKEVMTAWTTFQQKGKPLIYTYFKEFTISSNEINLEHLKSLDDFKEKLSELGHFYTIYKNIDDLKYKFSEQLSKIIPMLQNSQSNEQNIELKSKEYTVPEKKKTFRRQLLETEKKQLEEQIAHLENMKEKCNQQLKGEGEWDKREQLRIKSQNYSSELCELYNQLDNIEKQIEDF